VPNGDILADAGRGKILKGLQAVWRWIARSGKRIAVTIIGFALLAAGAVMLLTPGPGLVAILAGLAILGTQYSWARRALETAREKAGKAAKQRHKLRPFRRRR
jgi:uncharacterized protein (TIGR02611 family)